jgi:signal transduction histidine kinase
VLTNLLSNALKYSAQECPVALGVRAEGQRAVLTVRDEGAGIPAESLPHLFERFYRVPGVQVQSGSGVGMGLGLFITHEIVERHGGTIQVQSAVGEGTTFTVTLPLARES